VYLALGLASDSRSAPLLPTQSLGAFLTPVDVRASSAQADAGRTPRKLIDGSGLSRVRLEHQVVRTGVAAFFTSRRVQEPALMVRRSVAVMPMGDGELGVSSSGRR